MGKGYDRWGYVYVLQSKQEEIIKIGKTQSSPEMRAKEVEKQVGYKQYAPFSVLRSFKVFHPTIVEMCIHHICLIQNYQIIDKNCGNELFKKDALTLFDSYTNTPLDNLRNLCLMLELTRLSKYLKPMWPFELIVSAFATNDKDVDVYSKIAEEMHHFISPSISKRLHSDEKYAFIFGRKEGYDPRPIYTWPFFYRKDWEEWAEVIENEVNVRFNEFSLR